MQENSLLHDWLRRRHISDSVISEFNVHWGVNPILGECIVIPVLDWNGKFLFNKYRRNPTSKDEPKYLYDKGGTVSLYGMHKILSIGSSLLITEGEMDCLVAWSANIPAVTSTGGAMSFQPKWAEFLKEKEITICFDNDEAGGQGMAKTLEFLPGAYVVFIPDRPGIKDISDYVASGGDLAELLHTRIRFTSLQEVIDDRARRASLWQSTWFHDAFIKIHSLPEFVRSEHKKGMIGSDVANAKQYPIKNLLKFRAGKALCIWHSEKTGSLVYYKDNHVYCFGCGKGGDAIDVYRELNHCSFKEAVKALNSL